MTAASKSPRMPPLRLAVDARVIAEDTRGIGRYVRAILRRLAARNDVELTLLADGPFPQRKRGPYERALASDAFSVGARAVRDLDIIWHPANGSFFSSPLPSVATIHDAVPFRYPDPDPKRRQHAQEPFLRSARGATRVIAVSSFGRSEVHELLGVPLEKIEVIEHGVEASFTPGAAAAASRSLERAAVRALRRRSDGRTAQKLCIALRSVSARVAVRRRPRACNGRPAFAPASRRRSRRKPCRRSGRRTRRSAACLLPRRARASARVVSRDVRHADARSDGLRNAGCRVAGERAARDRRRGSALRTAGRSRRVGTRTALGRRRRFFARPPADRGARASKTFQLGREHRAPPGALSRCGAIAVKLLVACERVDAEGGTETYLRSLLPALVSRGYQVRVVARMSRNLKLTAFPHKQWNGATSTTRLAPMPRMRWPRLRASLGRTWRRCTTFSTWAILDVIRANAPRVVYHLHDHRPFCPNGDRLYPQGGSICEMAMGEFTCGWHALVNGCAYGPRPRTLALIRNREAVARAVGAGDATIAFSRYLANLALRNGINVRHTHVVAPALGDAAFAQSPAARPQTDAVLFAGRVMPSKGARSLVRAVASIPPPQRPLLRIAGVGPDLAATLDDARSRGVRLEALGRLDAAGLRRAYDDATIVAMPSLWGEPFGLAGIEAFARGRPVVAYDVGAISEWLRSGLGQLVPRG